MKNGKVVKPSQSREARPPPARRVRELDAAGKDQARIERHPKALINE